MKSLQEISAGLRNKLKTDILFGTVSTRVLLRTGVNLKQIQPEQNHNATLVEKVKKAVQELGYAIA